MRLMTCIGCKLAGNCGHASFLRSSLKGYGIRTIKFACALRENILQPGQPALFTTFTSVDDESGDAMAVTYPGYVIEQMGSKVFGFIKPGTPDTSEDYPFEAKSNGFVKMPLSRVHADPDRGNAPVESCRWCGSYPGLGDTRCDRHPHYTQTGDCLAARKGDAP